MSFTADPGEVAAGGRVTLSWRTRGAESITITANGDAVPLGGAKTAAGSVEVEVHETTAFLLRARSGKTSVTSPPVTITVGELRIVAFDATPSTIEAGEEVVLSWKTEYASTVSIEDAAGTAVELGEADAAEGSVKIVPSASTTYTLRAQAGSLSAEAKAAVRILGAPELEVGASPQVVNWGESVTLSWTMQDGEIVRIERDDALLHTSSDAEGTFDHQPSLTGSYVFTAERGELSSVQSVEVGVRPVVIAFNTAATDPVGVGETVEMRWRVAGATEVLLSNGAGFEERIEVESFDEGVWPAPAGPDGRFTIVAKSGDLETTGTWEVELLSLPTIGAFHPNRPVVSANPGESASVNLVWSGVERATELYLRGDTTGPIEIENKPDGLVAVSIDEETEFTLEAVNASGETVATTQVRVVPYPTIDVFLAEPSRVGVGESFELIWNTTGATSISLKADGSHVQGVSQSEVSGSTTLQIAAQTTYALRAFNEANDWIEESLVVTVGPPQILRFSGSPDYAVPGSQITFEWENHGGVRLTLKEGEEEICTSSVPGEIASGSCDHTIVDEGVFSFSLEVENTVGDVSTASATIVTSAGPHIVDFTASETVLTAGDPVEFAWEVKDDPMGATPTLTLSDGTANYDLAGSDPHQDSKSFPVHTLGPITFTLTATTPLGTKTATQEATVYGAPVATLAATPAEYDGSEPVTLSWTSEHAASLTLYELDAGGIPIEPPLYVVPEEERAAGSFDVHLEEATRYRIVVENGAGVTTTDEVHVTVAPPTIVSFEAIPDEVLEGEEVTLSWVTRMATRVDLSVVKDMVIEEISDPYVDIRTMGGVPVTMLRDHNNQPDGCGTTTFGAEDEGCRRIDFPAGFVFPFGGVDRTSIVMHANGFLGFQTTSSHTFENKQFPSHDFVSIAPFWDDISGPVNGFHMLFGSGDRGQFAIFQWTDVVLFSNAGTRSFQAVLWEDGSFDFRYGTGTGNLGRIEGNSATIGFRTPDGSMMHTLHQGGINASSGSPMPGGLTNRSWRFGRVTLEPTDTFVYTAPSEDVDVTLTAFGPGGVANDTLTITVHRRATVAVTMPTDEIEAGEVFPIAWTTTDAQSVVVLDEDDNVLCTALPEEIDEGSCDLSEATPGTYRYTVRATNAIGHEVETEVELQVYIPLSLIFEVSAEEIDAGENLTLIWQTTGAQSISLTANGVELLTGTEPMDDHVLVLQPTEKTTYVFHVESADGRSRTQSHTVEVRTFHFDIQASSYEVIPGTPVTISWTLNSLTGQPPTLLADWELTEVLDGTANFEDISDLGMIPILGTNQEDARANVNFPAGFTFPYYGETYSSIRVSVDGWASFHPSAGSWQVNQRLPIDSGYREVHLPVFWDDLHTQSGRVDATFLPNPDRFIIQWSHVGRSSPSTRGYDLNFQLVLFPDGRFEYRYGTMTPPTTPATATSLCNPLSCVDETNGSSATIGYQNPAGTRGSMFHYGGPSSDDDAPVPGGLSNRSFRYAPPTSNSVVVTPSDTSEYEFCASLGGFVECKIVRIEAPWTIDSFTASPEHVDAGDDVVLSWETRGADDLELTANGQPVSLAGKNWNADSLVLTPNGTTVYELTLHSLGRTTTSERTVEVRTVDLHVSGKPGRPLPGATGTVSWSASALASGTPRVYGPMTETFTSPFVDISTDPNVVELIGDDKDTLVVNHAFAGGFSFPYFGEEHASVRVSTDGYLSFDTNTATVTVNTPLPNRGTDPRRVHIAAFWDDIDTQTSGRVHALHANDGSYIIQWTAVSKWHGSSLTNEYDLNFQIVLFPSGSFEFRYGNMDPPSGTSTSCHPTNDCVGDANGASATIGYQDPGAEHGYLIHFGGGDQSSTNKPFPGGLAGRSFRMDASPTGSFTYTAGEDQDLSICAALSGYVECERIPLRPIAPGEVLITELMLLPADGEAQWFEVHNLTTENIDLMGWEIGAGADTHPIGQSLVIPANGFLTFSNGAATGFVADYEFNGLTLPTPAGDLRLIAAGQDISKITWSASWPIEPGQSLELGSNAQRPSIPLPPSSSSFCPRTETYDAGSNAGTPGWDGGSCLSGQPYVAYNYTGAEVFDIQSQAPILNSYNTVTSVPLGFSFPFFGTSTDQIWVSTSGYLTVKSASSTFTNVELPSSNSVPSAGLIAPFWDDHSVSRHNATVKFDEKTVGGQRVAIIDWEKLGPWSAPSSDFASVQAQLWEDGRIVFAYRRIVGAHSQNYGSSATIGLQEPTGSSPAFFLYSYNTVSLTEGQVMEFVPVAGP